MVVKLAYLLYNIELIELEMNPICQFSQRSVWCVLCVWCYGIYGSNTSHAFATESFYEKLLNKAHRI
jgi:hypothetical protein